MGLISRIFKQLPTEEKFAALYLKELRRAGDDREYKFNENEFRFDRADDNCILYLRNHYDEYCSLSKSERKQHLANCVAATFASTMELPEEFADVRPDIRVKLWCRTTIEKMILQQKIDGREFPDLPLFEIGNHLYASVVYDLPRAIQSLQKEDLENWGISFYEILELGKQNLLEDDFSYLKIGDGLYASLSGDNYDASRLLLNDIIQKLEVKGDTIAMVPNRDTLLLAGRDDIESLSVMLDLVEKAATDPRPMIFTPLILDGDTWADWMPSETHPLFQRFKRLEIAYLSAEYEDQKNMMNALYDMNSIDTFIATYTAMEDKNGELSTYCVWTQDVKSLLPKTDYVFFLAGNGDDETVYSGLWKEVLKITGNLIAEEEDMYPPRFRASKYPTLEQLQKIGQSEL